MEHMYIQYITLILILIPSSFYASSIFLGRLAVPDSHCPLQWPLAKTKNIVLKLLAKGICKWLAMKRWFNNLFTSLSPLKLLTSSLTPLLIQPSQYCSVSDSWDSLFNECSYFLLPFKIDKYILYIFRYFIYNILIHHILWRLSFKVQYLKQELEFLNISFMWNSI